MCNEAEHERMCDRCVARARVEIMVKGWRSPLIFCHHHARQVQDHLPECYEIAEVGTP